MADDNPTWTCEACSCRTNTERTDPISCGVCGTRRAPSLLRRGGAASRLLHDAFAHHAAADDDDDASENEETSEQENGSDEEDAMDHPHRHSLHSAEDDYLDDGQEEDLSSSPPPPLGMGEDAEAARATAAAVAALDAVGASEGGHFRRHGSANASRMLRAVAGGSAALSLLHAGGGGGRIPRSNRPSTANVRSMDPEAMLRIANEHAELYRPIWTTTSTTSSLGRHPASSPPNVSRSPSSSGGGTNGITVDAERHPHVAHLPDGAGEGRAVRASPPIPRSIMPSSVRNSSVPSPTGSNLERKRRRIFGFRVAFDHAGRDDGRSMGGCYLVGVTTSSFVAFGERSGLQQSRQFWGIEDGGRKYEGSTHHSSPSSSRRSSRHASSGNSNRSNSTSSTSHGMTLSRSEAPRNADNVLFGSRELITVVVDMDARTLTYWRDGRFLGTLVTNLPRSGHLYPVAVPFNAGVSVGITGMDGEPLSALSEFHNAQKRARKEKDDLRRQTLSTQRSNLIQNKRITPQLYSVLQNIFSWYATEETPPGTEVTLDAISVSRLWYRCGMKLSHLRGVLDASCAERGGAEPLVKASEFIEIVARVVAEEEEEAEAKKDKDCAFPDCISGGLVGSMGVRSLGSGGMGTDVPSSFEVGDKVEVSEGYERYGDAASGPLRPGYRGTVMEVQRGPRGDRQSVRVMHNGRRWWYQPQALLSERSGLLESRAVRFLRTILRSHGYDHTTLEPLWGKTVTSESWQLGDLVAPVRLSAKYARAAQAGRSTPLSFTMIGRIVPDTSSLPSAQARGRESGLVNVEFIDPLFGRAVGAVGGGGIGSSLMSVSTRKVKARNLVHTTFYHGATVIGESNFESARMESSIAADIESRSIANAVAAMVANSGEDEIYDDDQETSENADDSEGSTTDSGGKLSSFVVNETLKANVAKIAKLDTTAMNAVAKECGKNMASLAGLFAVGLPDAILSAIDYATDELNSSVSSGRNSSAVDASSVSALGSLSVAISKQLFANELDTQPCNTETAELDPWQQNPTTDHSHRIAIGGNSPAMRPGQVPVGMNNGPSPPWRPESSLQDGNLQDSNMPHSHPFHAPPLFNHPSNHPSNHSSNHPSAGGNSLSSRQHLNVRDLIRDLGNTGSSAEHRRGVLLALMAGARMSDSSSSMPNAVNAAREAEYRHLAAAAQQQRNRYDRLSAEAAAFGFGMGPTSSYNQQYPQRQHYHPPPLEDLSGALSAGMGGVGLGSPPSADMAAMAPSAMPPSSANITSPTASLPSTSATGHRSNSSGMRNSSMSFLDSLLRGHGGSNALFAAALSVSRTGSGSRGATQMSASMCSMIQNGLLLNNALWVKKVVGVGGLQSSSSSSIDVQSIRDEDGAPLLYLAISLGCSSAIVNSLIKAGARVSEKEVHAAAITNQPRTLSILLRHTVYSEGTIDISRCTAAVLRTLNQASERQKVQEDTMKRNAGEFTSRLLRKMVTLGLRFRLLFGRGSAPKSYQECSRAISDALVGDILLHAMHKNQHEGMVAAVRGGDAQGAPLATLSADDGRVPAFGISNPYGAAKMPLTSRGYAGVGSEGSAENSAVPLLPPPPNCLFRCLPPHVICKALVENNFAEVGSAETPERKDTIQEVNPLTAFLRLAESFLWSKNIRDASIGLSLIATLLRTPLNCQEELARYGIKDLAAAHLNFADEALSEIEANSRVRNTQTTPVDSGGNIMPGIVVCPKGHATILHLTRHSSFRCDLCGKGVQQGQPMHGCRECDWDACECCTDRSEGGLVKWSHVRGLALECQRILSGEDDELVDEVDELKGEDRNIRQDISPDDEVLQRLSIGLRGMKCESVHDLVALLKIPGRITFHEFKSYILPSLHSALLCNKTLGGINYCDNLDELSNIVTPCRRSKKPRVGGSRKSEKNRKYFSKSDYFQSHHQNQSAEIIGLAERETFVRTIVHTFMCSVYNAPEKKTVDSISKADENASEEEQRIAEVHMGDGPRDDEDDEEESDDGSSEQQDSSTAQGGKLAVVPEILRLLHVILAFNERVLVMQQKSPVLGNSNTGGNGGELRTLTHPIEIEFRLSPANEGNQMGNSSAPFPHQRHEQLSNLPQLLGDGATVHAEPLMPLAEIELHILRTCRIRTPAYLRYCRRLVMDQAIIVERKASACDVGSMTQDEKTINGNDACITRIAKVVGFDEVTGAHAVRYASLFLPARGSGNNGGGNETFSHNNQSLCDQLVFQGKETMLILAARNYFIVHRDQRNIEGYSDDGVHFGMDHDSGDAGAHFDVFVCDPNRHQNMDLCAPSPSVSNFPPPQVGISSAPSHFKERDGIHGDEGMSVSSQTLPFGMRVESDIQSRDGTSSVYTIVSSDIEGIVKSPSRFQGVNIQNSTEMMNPVSGPTYNIVSDDGEVFLAVPGKKIRGHDAILHQRRIQIQRDHERRGQHFMQMQGSHDSEASDPVGVLRASHHSIFERGMPIASVRRASSGTQSTDTPSSASNRSQQSSTPAVGVLKRTWSALSQIQKMSPLDLSGSNENSSAGEGSYSNARPFQRKMRRILIGEKEIEIDIDLATVEKSPSLRVGLSLYENISVVSMPCSHDITLFNAIQRLSSRDKSAKRRNNFALEGKVKLFYSILFYDDNTRAKAGGCFGSHPCRQDDNNLPNSFSPPWIRQGSFIDGSKLENDQYGDFMGRSSAPSNFAVSNVASFENNHCCFGDADMDLNMGVSNDAYVNKNFWSSTSDNINRQCITPLTRNDGSDVVDNSSLCDGLNQTCVKCMELLCVLAENASRYHHCKLLTVHDSAHKHDESIPSDVEQIMSLFESDALTNKLLEQLEDPLTVVGGALPDWCTLAPAFAPQVFSHSSRRLLLERAAFGVSRSALRQQEAKVAVAPLRQRMAALRGRAVELVGEAFSGGAADPTALQLQADELYGMEEALAARVSQAFRAQHWDERSLECAKAAVRRNALLQDASGMMEHYASDSRVRRRRLEVRFEGESGFDAASGDEAGVTRGFYADVAEALLSCEHVAGIFCSPACVKVSITNLTVKDTKLPLWIPDMDSSHTVIIPTPRADPRSVLGVFPRPIPPHHPQRKAILKQFRLMGRLFAAALRDGFVFPLPLSASFLKLVQSNRAVTSPAMFSSRQNVSVHSSASSLVSGEYLSNNSNSSVASSVSSSPVTNSNMSIEDCGNVAACAVEYNNSCNDPRNEFLSRAMANANSFAVPCSAPIYERANVNYDMKYSSASRDSLVQGVELDSLDLPRPGFLGGEIYAAETHVCALLDKLELAESTLSREEIEKRRKQIATDKGFARKALGKSYDCSFEEYFEDRTFVDPLDPMQGEGAVPLCTNGHLRPVTIDNIREWVFLAKKFVLHDGVMAQATAFRQGVDDFFPCEALRLFTAEELQQDVCGGGDNVDKWDEKSVRSLFKLDGGKGAAEALVAVAAMGGEGGAALSRRFGHSSPTVGYLVKALLQATSTQRRQFLSFVTSVPIVTPGQIEVVPVVNPSGDFLPMSDPCCLPRANTCARRLYLPKFESYESFCQVLWAVAREECRFKGFYEWRG